MTRFYQENKTEIFEIDHDGNQFEMFESMRVYIERNGRSNNYLPPVAELNVEREKHLIKEEADDKAEKASKVEAEKKTAEEKAAGLERLQGDRLSSIMGHMKEIGAQDKLNMRQFLMKHLSSTGDPAITCFSCSPSTDTDGTERKLFVIVLKFKIIGKVSEKSNNSLPTTVNWNI